MPVSRDKTDSAGKDGYIHYANVAHAVQLILLISSTMLMPGQA